MGSAIPRSLLIVLGSFCAALASIVLDQGSTPITAIWLPNAIAAGLWVQRRRFSSPRSIVAFAVGILAALAAAGTAWPAAIVITGVHLIEIAAVILLLSALLPKVRDLPDSVRVGLILIVVGIAGPSIAAPLATVALMTLTGLHPIYIFAPWFTGSLLGATMALPIVLTASRSELARFRHPAYAAAVLSYATFMALCAVGALLYLHFPFVALSLPLLFVAATFSPFVTAIGTSTVAVAVAIVGVLVIGEADDLLYEMSIHASTALAIGPPFLFSLLRHQLETSEARLKASDRMFRTAMENSAIGMAIVGRDGRFLKTNPRFREVVGYAEDELAQIDFRRITHPDDLAADEALVDDLLAGNLDHYELEKRYLRTDGTAVWSLLAVSIIRSRWAGEDDFFISQMVDIDRRRRSEEALRETNRLLFDEKERLRITLYSIGDAVITTDRWSHITLMNPAAERLSGWSRSDAIGRPLDDVFVLLSEATGEAIASPVADCLQTGLPRTALDGALKINRTDGWIPIRASAAPVRSVDGIVHGAVLTFQDVSQARALQRDLLHVAMHDALTGLPNRRSFEQSLAAACADAGRSVVRHVVGYLDLDRFKLINDTAGHAAGDAALRDIARVLEGGVRKNDVIARLGGDEFGLILFNCSVEHAQGVSEKLLAQLRATGFRWLGRGYEVGASIGLSEISGSRRDASEVLMEADVACYTAKTSGRHRVVAYHEEAHGAHRHRRDMDMATELSLAIESGRFRLYAQAILPVATADDGRFYEILVRLVGTDGELIGPAEFLPAAERYGLMAAIDRWILAAALDRCAEALAGDPGLRLSINLSTDSLDDPGLWPFIEAAIGAGGFAPGQICLEITETALVRSAATAIDFVTRAQAFGVRIALDDFGVGMSSFAYVKSFKPDEIKIDASFIHDVDTVDRDREIIRAIVQLGHALTIDVVAEGVETEAQFARLRALGVTRGQGFLSSRPSASTSASRRGPASRSTDRLSPSPSTVAGRPAPTGDAPCPGGPGHARRREPRRHFCLYKKNTA